MLLIGTVLVGVSRAERRAAVYTAGMRPFWKTERMRRARTPVHHLINGEDRIG